VVGLNFSPARKRAAEYDDPQGIIINTWVGSALLRGLVVVASAATGTFARTTEILFKDPGLWERLARSAPALANSGPADSSKR
jgi:hypothetical protein